MVVIIVCACLCTASRAMSYFDEPPVHYDRKCPLEYRKIECENAIATHRERLDEIRNNHEIIKVSD